MNRTIKKIITTDKYKDPNKITISKKYSQFSRNSERNAEVVGRSKSSNWMNCGDLIDAEGVGGKNMLPSGHPRCILSEENGRWDNRHIDRCGQCPESRKTLTVMKK